MRLIGIGTLTLLALVASGEAIKCYTCHNPGGVCNSTKDEGKEEDCPKGIECCMISLVGDDDDSEMKKMCGPTPDLREGCVRFEEDGKSGELCFCDEDLCNAATGFYLLPPYITTALLGSLAIVFYQYQIAVASD